MARKVRDPAMPVYAADWFGSQSVMLMTLEEEGAYMRLLLHSWMSGDCSLPDDDQALSVLSRLGQKWFEGSGDKIRKSFKVRRGKRARLVNEKLAKVWKDRRAHVEKCRQAGVKSGESRRSGTNERSPVVRTKHPTKTNSSSSSSSSSTSSISIIDVWLRKVKKETLKDVGLLLAWIDSAVAAGALDSSPYTRDRIAALAIRCREKGRNGGCGLFVTLMRAGSYDHATNDDFDRAVDAIDSHSRGQASRDADSFESNLVAGLAAKFKAAPLETDGAR